MKNPAPRFLSFVLVLLLLPVTAYAKSDMSRLSRDRAEIGRALLEMQSDNWTSLLPYYAQDIEYHDPVVSVNGIGQMAEFLGRLFASSPDLVTTVEDEVCVNGTYAATWTMDGSFVSVPYKAKGITIIKFRDKTTEVYYQRDYYTEGDIMAGIPLLDEVIAAFRTYYRCVVDPTFDCPFGPPPAGPDSQAMPEAVAVAGTKGLRREPSSNSSRINRKRKEIGRALIEINATNWPSLLQYYTDDIEYSDPIVNIRSIDTMGEFLFRLFASGPDLITTVEDEICINGIYMATWTMQGSLEGLPYTAKGMSIVKFRPGETKAYYAKDYYTEGDIMINIPLLDEPTAAFRNFYRCAVDPTFICTP